MEVTTLDELDGKILHSLSRNCRVSYNSLGSEIGLTTKSVKARVKKMQSSGVIVSIIVRVNPLALGYSKSCLLVLRINSKVADETHIRRSLSLLGDILNTDLLIQIVEFQNVREQPTYADFKIMRCILD